MDREMNQFATGDSRYLWPALVAVALILLAGCQPLDVKTQYDPYANFVQYQTFDWLPEKGRALKPDQRLLRQQLKFRVEEILRQRGILKDSASPDFLISYYGNRERKSRQQVVETTNYWADRDRYDLYRKEPEKADTHRWKYPPKERQRVDYQRTLETRTVTYTEGTLVLDFLDAESRQVVWQAHISGVLSRTDPASSLTRGVEEALARFPPNGAP